MLFIPHQKDSVCGCGNHAAECNKQHLCPGEETDKRTGSWPAPFFACVCLCVRACGIVCFFPPSDSGIERQLRKQGRWIFFGPPGSSSGGARMKRRSGRGGSKCQRPAVQQSQRPFDSVAMLLAGGRRYPLPQAAAGGGGGGGKGLVMLGGEGGRRGSLRSVATAFEDGGDPAAAATTTTKFIS